MRRLRRAIRAIVIRHNHTPIRDNLVIQNALEMLQASLGLVIRHLVPRLIYSRETEVSILPHLAVLDAVDDEGRVASGVEGDFVGVVDGEGYSFAAEPVANIVCVTVEEGNTNTVPEDLRELVDERVDKVAGGLEAGAYRARAGGGIIDVYAESSLRGGKIQKVLEVIGGCGVVCDVLAFLLLNTLPP